MPPARLPARIDRSGLGGGSFFSPAAEEGSVLATGAVAAATEAMLVLLGYDPVVAFGGPIACPVERRCSVASNERGRAAADRVPRVVPVPRGAHDGRRAGTHFEIRGRVGSGARRRGGQSL